MNKNRIYTILFKYAYRILESFKLEFTADSMNVLS